MNPPRTITEIRRALLAHEPDTEPSLSAPKRAAVAMILRNDRQLGLEILFIQRAINPLDPWSGHMALPGGHVDPDDESIEAAARRETLEEVGLQLSEKMKMGRLSDLSGGRLKFSGLSVSPFVFHYSGPAELQLSDEVADAVWVPLDYLSDSANVKPYVYHLDPARRNFPSFQYNGYTIWGLTYRMLGQFLELFDVNLPGEDILSEVE